MTKETTVQDVMNALKLFKAGTNNPAISRVMDKIQKNIDAEKFKATDKI